MGAPSLKSALEDLLKTHRLQAQAPPLRGERRFSPLATGMAGLDDLLGGGFPRGQVSEVHGPASSGRTGLALAVVARALRRGALAAWVDPGDRLDPASAGEAGLDLSRLLWLRGQAASLALPRAVAAAATLVNSGLFELVVLDLAGLPPAEPARLPHSTWLRLQRAVETSPSALLLLGDAHLARGPGGVSLSLALALARWSGHGPGRLLTGLDAEAHLGQRPRGARFELQAFA